MPVLNIPKFTQAEYIERCIWFLDDEDLELVFKYRQASEEEKVRILQGLIEDSEDPEDTVRFGLFIPNEHEEALEYHIAQLEAQTEPMQTSDPALLKLYLAIRRVLPGRLEIGYEKRLIYDDSDYKLTDPNSEEWKVFCVLKSIVDTKYAHGLEQATRLKKAIERVLRNFITFSDDGEDIRKSAQGFTREGEGGTYLHFKGMTEEESGEPPEKRWTEEAWRESLASLGHLYV